MSLVLFSLRSWIGLEGQAVKSFFGKGGEGEYHLHIPFSVAVLPNFAVCCVWSVFLLLEGSEQNIASLCVHLL